MNKRIKAAGVALLLACGLSAVPETPTAQATAAVPVTISGVDSHDGQIYEHGGTLYWVGTRYACGFAWTNPATPWCGFGVWTAPQLAGPWTFVRELFSPAGTSVPAYHQESWQTICRGDGCFNPRMTMRPDGVWVLWFNAPRDLRVHGGNQFWAMGCNGPAGPCGTAAGAPYGGTYKPPLWICSSGGDFAILDDAGTWYLVCGTSSWTISIERLASWGGAGTGVGVTNVAGLVGVEGVGVARTMPGQYLLTYGANCPYCSGTDTSYAVASTPLGPYLTPPGAPARRSISAHSCGGQPRGIVTLGAVDYQQVDHWYAGHSQPLAATSLIPLVPSGPPLGPADGSRWHGGFAAFDC